MGDRASSPSLYRSILTIKTPDGQTQKIRLRENEATIFGRSRSDVILKDTEISSTHCQIYFLDGDHYILDMNSTNGTFVNETRIIKSKLRHNDIISLGQSSIVFQRIKKKNSPDQEVAYSQKKIHGKERTRFTDHYMDEVSQSTERPQIEINAIYHDGSTDHLVFHQEEVCIGRASSFGRFDQDDQISREHIRIKINSKNEIYVEDQSSTNGFYINDQKATGIQKVQPADDIVIIGNTQLIISIAKHKEAS